VPVAAFMAATGGAAADLTISKISLNDRKNVTENKRSPLPASVLRLSGQKAEMAAYTMTLKRK